MPACAGMTTLSFCDGCFFALRTGPHGRSRQAAIGLVHFFPHGRIVEVCGNEVKRLYFEPYQQEGFDNDPRKNG